MTRPEGLPAWAEWNATTDAFTVGLEEEVMLLDPADLSLVHEFDRVRPRLSADLARRLTPETHGASVELTSDPHARVAETGGQLAALRARLGDELAIQELAVASAGTHPFATWTETEISEGRRYRYLHATMRELARREPTHALHVHVCIPDPERAVEIANRLRAHLPLLLAVSANSPFWQDRDSGLASARTPVWDAFPRVGIPRPFRGYRDYVDALQLLIECGAFPDPSFVWWDLRLQPGFGTIEIRIMDAQTESWRATALAALVQCLAHLEATEPHAEAELIHNPEVLEENHFLASRDGVDAELIDPVARATRPVRELAESLLTVCAPHAQELGCASELADVARILDEPGHELQRHIAGPRPDLQGLIAWMCERFAAPDAATRPAA
jgi:carboxylate-amine ligase